MIGSRNIVSLFWILSASSVLGSNAIPEDNSGDNRSLRAVVGGNLFGGLFAKKMCRKTSDGVYNTISTSRFRFRANTSPGDLTGACSSMCKDLCPTTCYGSFKVDGSSCSCAAPKCGGNAVCNASKKCECKANFDGNGLICCDTFSGFAFASTGCVVRPVAPPTAAGSPTAPLAPVAAPPSPGTTPVTPVAQAPSGPGPAPITPVAAAPRAPSVGRKDKLPPKLVDLVLTSPNVVDVSANDAKVDFQITLTDDWTGVKYISVYIQDAIFRYRPIVYEKTLTSPGFGNYVHAFSVPVSKYFSQGVHDLYIGIGDSAGNSAEFESEALAKLGLPYDIEVINTKNDTMPPKVLGMVPLTPTVVNVTELTKDKDIDVIFQVTVQDDFAGLERLDAEFINPSGYRLSDRIYSYEQCAYDNCRLAGEPVMLNLTVSVGSSFSSFPGYLGIYNLSTIAATDYARKGAYYTAANLTFIPSITLVK